MTAEVLSWKVSRPKFRAKKDFLAVPALTGRKPVEKGKCGIFATLPLTGGVTVLARCNLLRDQANVSFCYISWTYYPAADWLEFV